MSCTIEQKLIDDTISFHGHSCPGLAIGIRTAELAIKELDIQHANAPLCVTETDMCGVDAIQFLTGCSFGKGNLIHKDYGKSAFTFYNRDTGKGFRAVFQNPPSTDSQDREERIRQLMDADLDTLFILESIDAPPVRPARILKSIQCDTCNEMTMESRIRLFDGKHLCMPCFQKVEQKQ